MKTVYKKNKTCKTHRCIILIFMAVFISNLFFSSAAFAQPISIVVKTVLASRGKMHVDPRLSPLIKDLQTVFRYSSYELLSENRMSLAVNRPGSVGLPGNRVLRITPVGISGNRASLKLEISKNGAIIFQTSTAILNHGSITVGGPEHMGGYLLFNIANSF